MAPSALEDLQTKQKKLDCIGEQQEKRVRYFESTTLLLVGNYIIFQAIIFLSVSNHAKLSCKYWWIPFCLSFLVALVFAITFRRFVSNWERTQFFYDKNFLKRDLIHHQIVVFTIRASKGCSFDQVPPYDHQQRQQPQILECDKVKLYQRYAFISLVSVALLAYTIIVLGACRSILCNG
ncbi:hypothetical protein M0R45_025914 [Rubus argutus]|uniref:Transmembrane protein n=1 Tax=Rubus argutus TaxID=59490 RepID=A0AAW1WVK4_RUBAR